MLLRIRLLLCIILLPNLCYADNTKPLKVVASILPIHSLVANVAEHHVDLTLLIPASTSPHNYHLKPSNAKTLSQADVIVWLGPEIENFLTASIKTLAPKATTLQLTSIPGIQKLSNRAGGLFTEAKTHPKDEHEHHDDEHAHHHDHGSFDPHIWLSPDNAIVITKALVKHFSALRPEHQSQFEKNGKKVLEQIAELRASLNKMLAPVNQKPYIVFHDAYQYFESAFKLNAKGALLTHPEKLQSAQRIKRIQTLLKQHNIVCLFSEPQFKPAMVQRLIENTSVKTAQLDPIGATLTPGPDAYIQLMKQLGKQFVNCLQ